MNILEPYYSYSYLQIITEIIASIIGILSVILIKEKKIIGLYLGIISTFLYSYLLFQWELFADMIINIYYTIMGFYGCIFWNKNINIEKEFKVSTLNQKDLYKLFLIFILSFFTFNLVYYLKNNNEFIYNNFSIIDCFTSSIFILAMYLMARIKLEHWFFWIIGNSISIFLYYFKGYSITSFQYLIFTIIAIAGFKNWKKSLNKSNYIIK